MALLALTLALAGLGVLGLARRDTAEPSPSSPPPALAVPAVASLLDGIRLSLPSPPPEGTRAELRSMDGTLLVERPMRGTTVVLKPPRDTTGDLRWAIRAGTAAREGVAPVGPRLLFDAATHATDPSVPNLDVPLPPFFHDGRLVMGLTPTTLFTLRPTRVPGQPLTLDLLGTRSLPVRAHPGRPAGSRGVARSRFAIADLAPLGPHTLLAGLFGTPGTFLTLDVDPSVEAVVATMKGHEVVDTLAAPMPGGGCVMAGDLMVNSAAEARRQVILAFSNGPGTNPGQGILTLEGRTPLGLAAMDADTVLLAYEGPSGALASVLRTDGTTVSVVASLDLGFQAPPWRDETHAAGLTLSGGGAALALADRLVVARPDGRLSVRTLDLGPRGRVGLVTPSPDGSLVLVVCRLEPGLAASLSSVGTLVLPLAGSSTPPGEPTLLTRPTEHVDDILPLGQLPTSDGGVLVWCCGTLYDTSGPPLFARSRTWTLDTRAGWLLAHDGAAFIVTTKGRVYGFDLERP